MIAAADFTVDGEGAMDAIARYVRRPLLNPLAIERRHAQKLQKLTY
jgi:hypothetical protein